MSTFGTDNHSTPLFPSVGRTVRSTAAVDALRTSFAAALEASKQSDQRRDDPASDRAAEQQRNVEGVSQRKNLDKHEIETALDRGRQLDDEYRHRTDRREWFNEKPETEPAAKIPDLLTTANPAVSGNTPLSSLSTISPNNFWSRQDSTTELPSIVAPSLPTVPPTISTDVAFPPTILFPQTAAVASPVLPTAPTPMLDPISKPSVDLSAFTIFTVSGRFGSVKKEKELDDKKSEKRERSVSLFGPLLSSSVESDDAESSAETASGTRRSKTPEEPSGRTSIEPANIELPQKEKEGISLKELFDSKAFVPTCELYRGDLAERIDNVESDVQTQADRVRFVQRVAAACRSAAQQQGTVRIKLHPESLGPLTIRVSTKKGKISVQFETESDDAKRLLLDNLDNLKSRLRDMQLELEDCRVD